MLNRKKSGVIAAIALLVLIAVAATLARLHDFLAMNAPVAANVLVVEAWIWQAPAMREAADEFMRGHYDRAIAVGAPVEEESGDRSHSSAELAAARLKELGVPAAAIVTLPLTGDTTHRTYRSALLVREWLRRSHERVTGLNVFTLGSHGRKSLILFQRALGSGLPLGVISGTDHTFDPKQWWISPRGIYVIARKTAGYLYAVFWPLPHGAE